MSFSLPPFWGHLVYRWSGRGVFREHNMKHSFYKPIILAALSAISSTVFGQTITQATCSRDNGTLIVGILSCRYEAPNTPHTAGVHEYAKIATTWPQFLNLDVSIEPEKSVDVPNWTTTATFSTTVTEAASYSISGIN